MSTLYLKKIQYPFLFKLENLFSKYIFFNELYLFLVANITVFSSSIAIVIGPTPPGTGVI